MFGDGKGRQYLESLVQSFTRIPHYDMRGDHKLKWTRVPGDWVVRDGVAPEKMLQGLEAVLRDECKLPVRFRLVEEDRPIIVVKGKYVYRPLPGRSTVTEDRKYGYEGDDLQDYDQLDLYEHDRAGLTSVRSGTLAQLLADVRMHVARPLIDEGVQLPEDMTSKKPSKREHFLEWRSKTARIFEAHERGDLDEAALLKRVSEQTGLTFSKEMRRGRVLWIERAE